MLGFEVSTVLNLQQVNEKLQCVEIRAKKHKKEAGFWG
jgi:hypothetical protein